MLKEALPSKYHTQFFLRDTGSNIGVNMDITYRCPLECLRCSRQYDFKRNKTPVWGQDIPLETIDKITDVYKSINFCGQLSDPVHHPKFIEILEICYRKNIYVVVHNASSAKSESWYIKAFKANPKANWWFGIDGLPEESHRYRINQDGEKLYNIMLKSKEYLINKPTWQYIIFNYNEDHMEQAKKMAIDNNVNMLFVYSSKWLNEDDPLRPSKKDNHIFSEQHLLQPFVELVRSGKTYIDDEFHHYLIEPYEKIL